MRRVSYAPKPLPPLTAIDVTRERLYGVDALCDEVIGRRYARGESVARIATALGLSRNHVSHICARPINISADGEFDRVAGDLLKNAVIK